MDKDEEHKLFFEKLIIIENEVEEIADKCVLLREEIRNREHMNMTLNNRNEELQGELKEYNKILENLS